MSPSGESRVSESNHFLLSSLFFFTNPILQMILPNRRYESYQVRLIILRLSLLRVLFGLHELIALFSGKLLHCLHWTLQAHMGQFVLSLLQEGRNHLIFLNQISPRNFINSLKIRFSD